MTAVRITDDLDTLIEENAKLRQQETRQHALLQRHRVGLAEARELLLDANRIIADQDRALAEAHTALVIALAHIPNHPEISRVVGVLRGRVQ